MAKASKHKSYLLYMFYFCFFCFVLGCSLFYYMQKRNSKTKNLIDTITLNTSPIVAEDVTTKNKYIGHVEAINHVQIVPYVSGYIKDVVVKPGEMVDEGDLLITIDPKEYETKLKTEEALVDKAKAALNYSENYYNRVIKSGNKAFSEIEQANAKSDYLQAQAALKSAEANRDFAKINYDYTKIKASFSGLIGNFDLSPGDYVSPSSPFLLDLVQIDPVRVVFSISDVEYLNFNEEPTFKDSVIKLVLANGKTFKYPGKIEYTDNKVNKNTNSLAVYAYFQNHNKELLPNAFVTIEAYHTFKNAVLIDKNYINMESSGYFLNIARKNHVLNVPIKILAEKGNQYIIKNTFLSGDMLILDDTSSLNKTTNISFNVKSRGK